MSNADRPPGGGESSNGFTKKGSSLGKAFSNLDLDGHNLPPSPVPSSPRNGRKYALATELVYTDSGDQYNASSMPIYQVRSSFLSLVL
jgi:cystathionine beta-lyase